MHIICFRLEYLIYNSMLTYDKRQKHYKKIQWIIENLGMVIIKHI